MLHLLYFSLWCPHILLHLWLTFYLHLLIYSSDISPLVEVLLFVSLKRSVTCIFLLDVEAKKSCLFSFWPPLHIERDLLNSWFVWHLKHNDSSRVSIIGDWWALKWLPNVSIYFLWTSMNWACSSFHWIDLYPLMPWKF